MGSDYDQLSKNIDVGVLADDVVLGVSRALRGAELADHQAAALEQAEWLLSYLSKPEAEFGAARPRSDALRELVSTQHQAEQVARERQPSIARTEYFGSLLQLLRRIRSAGVDPAAKREPFNELLDFFERLGHVTHAEARDEIDDISQPAWMPSRPTGIF